MNDTKEEIYLQTLLGELVPEAKLEWQRVPNTDLFGFLLEFESASVPLAPCRVQEVMDSPPFWSLLWPAGNFLCQLFSSQEELLRDRRCVDLGCGSGLVAAAVAKGGGHVLACDSDPFSMRISAINALRNGIEIQLSSNWNSRTETLILADFLYDESNLDLLPDFLAKSQEILVIDSRLKALVHNDFFYLGEWAGVAVPDLDPHKEFGALKVWYSGPRRELWENALQG